LAKLGWIEGRTLHIDFRFASADPIRIRTYASELVRLAPDVLVTGTGPAARAVREETQTTPIVAVGMGDPGATRLVENIARPENNVTGFVNLFNSLGGKWLELLKEAAPRLRRVAVVVDPDSTVVGLDPYLIEPAAQTFAVDVEKIAYQNIPDLVRAIDAFAVRPGGGLLILPGIRNTNNRAVIVQLAAQHRLPAIYTNRAFAAEGGLVTHLPTLDFYRGAATYVDRLLRGAKVSELPVQFPTKFELVVNLKTAKAIGLAIPEAFLLRADELIE
jgi:putative ABC transport system substrate-binding protein